MTLPPLLITAGVFTGVSLTMLCLYYLLSKFRPSVHQLPPPSPKPTAEDPKMVLGTIPVVGYTENEGFDECSVCLSSVEEGEKVRILPDCGHGFHAQCIDEWLCSQLSCPFCRSPVTAPENPSDIKSAAESLTGGLRSLMCIKMAFWQNRAWRSSPRDDDGSNGGGESAV